MTAHEVFTALFWIVAGGYLAYVGWFLARAVRARFVKTAPLPRRSRSPR